MVNRSTTRTHASANSRNAESLGRNWFCTVRKTPWTTCSSVRNPARFRAVATCRLVHRNRADDAGWPCFVSPRAHGTSLTCSCEVPWFPPNSARPGATSVPKPRQQTRRSIAGAVCFRLWSARRGDGQDPEGKIDFLCSVSATSGRYHGREVRRNKGSRHALERRGGTEFRISKYRFFSAKNSSHVTKKTQQRRAAVADSLHR